MNEPQRPCLPWRVRATSRSFSRSFLGCTSRRPETPRDACPNPHHHRQILFPLLAHLLPLWQAMRTLHLSCGMRCRKSGALCPWLGHARAPKLRAAHCSVEGAGRVALRPRTFVAVGLTAATSRCILLVDPRPRPSLLKGSPAAAQNPLGRRYQPTVLPQPVVRTTHGSRGTRSREATAASPARPEESVPPASE